MQPGLAGTRNEPPQRSRSGGLARCGYYLAVFVPGFVKLLYAQF